ncbi:MAG: hypothetical protein D6808_02980 [Candidatus Dadabacteria bacterium]|nr:MAG: hypothetical protein D6808_02980 [Candidatus Dadabacteria bacterium]
MKGKVPQITLLGSNSGNNAGDAAILASILDILSKELPNALFYVPTTNPEFIAKNYGALYNVIPVNIMPWTGSVRLLGIPTIKCFRKSDIALICDGIIFDVKLFNPAFNFLITLVPLVPLAKIFDCKLVCYSTGIGPLQSPAGQWMAKYVMENCDLLMMREKDSLDLCRAVGVSKEIELTGDPAFLNRVSSTERASAILKELGIEKDNFMGFNVTSYVDRWLDPNSRLSDKAAFFDIVLEGIRDASKLCGFKPLLFSTHPMDEDIAVRLAQALNTAAISSRQYLSHDIMAVMRECSLFMGMRFHSLVFASAVGVPILGLVYAPKVRSYFRLLQTEQYGFELKNISSDLLKASIQKAWKEKEAIRAKQQKVVENLKRGAKSAARVLKERYFQEYAVAMDSQRDNRTIAKAHS